MGSEQPGHISILGGGIAGLAVGYYAKKSGVSFTVYEASDRLGGNCITFRHGSFLFDSGAHRVHDVYPDVTNEIRAILKTEFKLINRPSQIYHNGKFIDFPLSLLNLIKNIGPGLMVKALFEAVLSRLKSSATGENFEAFLVSRYGRSLSELFLLNYSEKLWGIPCSRLAPEAAKKRLKGLGLKALLFELLDGEKITRALVDGSFYYPVNGIGELSDGLVDYCGIGHIRKMAEITKILHTEYNEIREVEINGNETVATEFVVSSLPVDVLLNRMEPQPPRDVCSALRYLRYRCVILVAFFLEKESVSDAATLYFPDSRFPFTRVYEPKNRSIRMAPDGQTSLVAEIPCDKGDDTWCMTDATLIEKARSKLLETKLIKDEEILGTVVHRLDYAYPCLDLQTEKQVNIVISFLSGFRNLKLSGRPGSFKYCWIHDLMADGRNIVERFLTQSGALLHKKTL